MVKTERFVSNAADVWEASACFRYKSNWFCNSLLYGLPAKQLDKIQRVQNTAARIIFRLHPDTF